MKKRFQTPLCALSALVLAAACTTAAYAAEIPVPADAVPVPQAAPADVADATPGADLVLPDAGTTVAERTPMPVGDAPAVWTEGRSAVVSTQAPTEGKKPDPARNAPAVTAAQAAKREPDSRPGSLFCCALRGIFFYSSVFGRCAARNA